MLSSIKNRTDMKKTILSFVLTFIILTDALPQSCLPNGIVFSNQTEIDNFSANYPGCTKIEGRVVIDDLENDNITNLFGLSNLQSIGAWIRIHDNNKLTSLLGLNNLDSVAMDITIQDNKSIKSLSGLEKVNYIGEYLDISYNDSLLSLDGIGSLDTLNSFFIISNNSLTSLTGLQSLSFINTNLLIERNALLSSLNGLDQLSMIGNDFKIINNDSLINLEGVENLTHIANFLRIRNNYSITSLAGLENLDSINGGISISGNGLLSSLVGLDGAELKPNSYLSINNNPFLTNCAVKSICDKLLSSTGTVEIFNNSNGCNNIEEVEEACFVHVSSLSSESDFTIYPNPARNELSFSSNNGKSIINIAIYNQLGQKVLHQITPRNKIDISTLEQGLYIIELQSNELKSRIKIMINK